MGSSQLCSQAWGRGDPSNGGVDTLGERRTPRLEQRLKGTLDLNVQTCSSFSLPSGSKWKLHGFQLLLPESSYSQPSCSSHLKVLSIPAHTCFLSIHSSPCTFIQATMLSHQNYFLWHPFFFFFLTCC